MPAQVVDLFCGVGGLTRGLRDAGLNVAAGFDIDLTCKYAYEANNSGVKFIEKNIRDLKGKDINAQYSPDVTRILVGCAPCQPFSNMRTKMGEAQNQKDEKYNLLLEFGRIIKESLPSIVSMENVPQIEKTDVFKKFLKILDSCDYNYDYKVVYCPDYGIAQNRRRFVLVASLLGPISLIPATHNKNEVNVQKYIKGLPKVEAGGVCETDPLHTTAKLSKINMQRIKVSKPGGTWKDWPEELRAKCHRKASGKTYTSVYSRMEWEKIGPTITTQFHCFGTGRFGHPEQDRALTLREGALLQTFPLEYDFINPDKTFCLRDIARHIGNAVPVRLGEIIGKSIIEHLEIYD